MSMPPDRSRCKLNLRWNVQWKLFYAMTSCRAVLSIISVWTRDGEWDSPLIVLCDCNWIEGGAGCFVL